MVFFLLLVLNHYFGNSLWDQRKVKYPGSWFNFFQLYHLMVWFSYQHGYNILFFYLRTFYSVSSIYGQKIPNKLMMTGIVNAMTVSTNRVKGVFYRGFCYERLNLIPWIFLQAIEHHKNLNFCLLLPLSIVNPLYDTCFFELAKSYNLAPSEWTGKKLHFQSSSTTHTDKSADFHNCLMLLSHVSWTLYTDQWKSVFDSVFQFLTSGTIVLILLIDFQCCCCMAGCYDLRCYPVNDGVFCAHSWTTRVHCMLLCHFFLLRFWLLWLSRLNSGVCDCLLVIMEARCQTIFSFCALSRSVHWWNGEAVWMWRLEC